MALVARTWMAWNVGALALGAVVLGAWLAPGEALALDVGISGHSGKANGLMCTQCHFAYNKNVRVGVELLNQDLTPATQPVNPEMIYTFRITQTYGTPVSFRGGFNLAVGNAEAPTQVGILSTRAGTEAEAQILNGEATHRKQQGQDMGGKTSTAVNGAQAIQWLVDWSPPARGIPGGMPYDVKVHAAVTKVNAVMTATEVRALSSVSNTPNAANAPECGPMNLVGFDPAACGITVSVAPVNCADMDNDNHLPATCVLEVERGGGDCDDNNPFVSPSATELCNLEDDDCDGETDEGFALNGIPLGDLCDSDDTDMCSNGVVLCSDDTTAAVCVEDVSYVEICGNNSDDDCDGATDETEGLTWEGKLFGQACDADADDDRCELGIVQCEASRPACVGDRPTPEFCGNNEDDDCDGTTDELVCMPVPDGGVPPRDAGIPPPDAGVPDAAGVDAAGMDAAVPPDAAVAPDAGGASSSSGGGSSSSSGGTGSSSSGSSGSGGEEEDCACSQPGDGTVPAAAWAGLWAMVVVTRRRRAGRQPGPTG